MKRIIANLALMGSFLISAAVLSPLLQANFGNGAAIKVLSLLISPDHPQADRIVMFSAAPVPTVVSRANYSTASLADIATE